MARVEFHCSLKLHQGEFQLRILYVHGLPDVRLYIERCFRHLRVIQRRVLLSEEARVVAGVLTSEAMAERSELRYPFA